MSSRRRLFICACLGLLTFGVVLTTLGAVLPSIMLRFGIDKAEAGSLFFLMTLGILGGSLIVGPLVDRYGYKWLLVAATALIALGLAGIAFASSMPWLRAAVVVIGLGGGFVNSGSNALVADISPEERAADLSLLGVFFGLGAMGVPFVLGILINSYSQAALVAGVAVLVLIPFAFMTSVTFPPPKQAQGFPLADAGKLIRDRVLLLMGLMLFLESGVEITVGGWTSTFVTEVLAVGASSALIILSMYWLGMMLARIALGSLLRGRSPFGVLFFCIATAVGGAALLLTTATPALAALGVFMLGAGFAATFPVVLGLIGDRYAALSGTAFSVAIAMALVGGMSLPYAAGILGKIYGMRASFAIVPAALLVLAGLLGILIRKLRVVTPAS